MSSPFARFLPTSLVGRVYALYTATFLLFVGGGLAAFLLLQYESEIGEATASAAAMTDIVFQSVADSAVAGDHEAVRRKLRLATVRSPFSAISYVDALGFTIRVTVPVAPSAEAPAWLARRVAARLPEVTRGINVDGAHYGVLRFRFAADAIAGGYWQLAQIAVVVGLASVLGGLIVIWLPLRHLLGNLERLKAFEEDVQAGRFDPRKFLAEDAPVEFRRAFELLGRTASSLRSEREQASIVLASVGDGVLSLDAAGKVVYCNPAASEVLALPANELLGRNAQDLLPSSFVGQGGLEPWRSRRLHISVGVGKRRMVETSLSTIPGMTEDAVGHALVVRDVTEAYELEEKLLEALAARQGALESLRGLLVGLLPDDRRGPYAGSDDIGVVSSLVAELVREREAGRLALDNQKFALDQHAIVSVADREGRIVYANDRFCEVTGYAREEVLGRRHDLVKSGVHPESMYRELWETILAGRVWQGELCNRTKDGALKWFSSTIVPLTGGPEGAGDFIGIATDITALKSAEAALQRAKEAAEAASRAKSDFLANMSHEIRTPMNGIIGMTSLALDTPLDDEQREYLRIVKSSAESLLVIINDILDLSKIEAGKLVVESAPFDVRRAVEDAVRTLSHAASAKGLEVVVRIDPDMPEQVVGDSGRVRQVLVNLLGNAIKFTERGAVTVEARLLDPAHGAPMLEVAVSDTGIGIAPDKLEHVFDAFTQEDASITRRYGGTGLGLAISKRLVTLMGGRIGAESEPGKGSTFTFAVAVARATGAMMGEVNAARFAGRRVLVVNDSADSRQVLRRLLERSGLAVEEAEGTDAAIAKLMGGPRIDGLVLDADMPEMSGAQFAAVLSQPAYASVRPPVVLLGHPEGFAAGERPPGVDAVLDTPVAPAELLAALRRGLEPPPASRLALHVLLVEDNVINEKVAVALLEKRGCRVSVARDGLEALAACERERFDVALMDMQMPVMDGLEATRRLRQVERERGLPRMPVLAMTANAMLEDREACLAAGMDDFLTKPIRPEEFFASLGRVAPAGAPAEARG
jgi:PAS domain S-box-containing protein